MLNQPDSISMGGRAHYSVIWGGVHWQKYNDFSV